jgi:hypothetical protein
METHKKKYLKVGTNFLKKYGVIFAHYILLEMKKNSWNLKYFMIASNTLEINVLSP